VRRVGLRAIGLAPLSSELSLRGDDLTDERGEAPILSDITLDDLDMPKDEEDGLLGEFTGSTGVGSIKAKDKKDKVVADAEAED